MTCDEVRQCVTKGFNAMTAAETKAIAEHVAGCETCAMSELTAWVETDLSTLLRRVFAVKLDRELCPDGPTPPVDGDTHAAILASPRIKEMVPRHLVNAIVTKTHNDLLVSVEAFGDKQMAIVPFSLSACDGSADYSPAQFISAYRKEPKRLSKLDGVILCLLGNSVNMLYYVTTVEEAENDAILSQTLDQLGPNPFPSQQEILALAFTRARNEARQQ